MLSVGRFFVNRGYGALRTNRMLSMHTINENLYLCTEKPRNIEIDKKSLRFTQVKENKKPIVLILSWFYGEPSQINKYSQLYTENGMDVLVGRITLIQFMLKIKSTEKFGQDIAKALANNEDQYNEIFVHTFSVGCGLWGLTQRMIKKEPENFGKIPKRVIGQIFDSVADTSKIIVAIPFALFPKSLFMRNLLTVLLWLPLNLNRPLQRHFQDAMENFNNNLAKSPALVVVSKTDPIGTEDYAKYLVGLWRKNGMDVTLKVFEDSPHVKHYKVYREEYLKLMHDLWEKVKLLDRK